MLCAVCLSAPCALAPKNRQVGFGQATRTGGGWWDRFLRHVAIKHGADSPESDLAAIMVSKIQAEAVAATCTVAAKGKGPK